MASPPDDAASPPSPSSASAQSLRVISEVCLVSIVIALLTLLFLAALRRARFLVHMRRHVAQAQASAADGATGRDSTAEGFVNLFPRQQQRTPALTLEAINDLGLVSEYKGSAVKEGDTGATGLSESARKAGSVQGAGLLLSSLRSMASKGNPVEKAQQDETGTDVGSSAASAGGAAGSADPEMLQGGSSEAVPGECAPRGVCAQRDPALLEGPQSSSGAVQVEPAACPGGTGGAGASDVPLVAMNECAVCLAEYRSGELLRTLKKCGHHFHKDCIDAWLGSRATCPLCRTLLEPEKASAPAPAPQPAQGATSQGDGVSAEARSFWPHVVVVGVTRSTQAPAAAAEQLPQLQGQQEQQQREQGQHREPAQQVEREQGQAYLPLPHGLQGLSYMLQSGLATGADAPSSQAVAPARQTTVLEPNTTVALPPWTFLHLPFQPFQSTPLPTSQSSSRSQAPRSQEYPERRLPPQQSPV